MSATQEQQSTAEVIRALAAKNGGQVTPELILDAAKPKTSPLHSFFCWDNTKAANAYRLVQAQALIRRIKVTYLSHENRNVRVRAFVNIEPEAEDEMDAETGIYISVEDALSSKSYRDQLLAQAKKDANTFKAKYAALSEVSAIINAIDQIA